MKRKVAYVVVISLFIIFIVISFLMSFEPGKIIAFNLVDYSFEIIQFFPFAFILIGLFQVWIKRETVEKHLGKDSGWQGYFWAIILGGCTFGPLIVVATGIKRMRKLMETEATIRLRDKTLIAEAKAKMYIIDGGRQSR